MKKEIVAINQSGTEFTREEYIKWMYNLDNEFNCPECPHNDGFNNGLPCGQQNCWVTCHCR